MLSKPAHGHPRQYFRAALLYNRTLVDNKQASQPDVLNNLDNHFLPLVAL